MAITTIDTFLEAIARAPDLAPGPAHGEVIGGSFRIERRLGAGGMGEVFLARDLRLDRAVAVKLHRGDEDLAVRTRREAMVMARLNHPNVVTVHEVGEWRGRIYIAMEYLDGGTLRQWLAARRRRWREILAVFHQAARGLVAAHDAGLVHRDFKPDNVLLTADGRVRVADFGVARAGEDLEGPGARVSLFEVAKSSATGARATIEGSISKMLAHRFTDYSDAKAGVHGDANLTDADGPDVAELNACSNFLEDWIAAADKRAGVLKTIAGSMPSPT